MSILFSFFCDQAYWFLFFNIQGKDQVLQQIKGGVEDVLLIIKCTSFPHVPHLLLVDLLLWCVIKILNDNNFSQFLPLDFSLLPAIL